MSMENEQASPVGSRLLIKTKDLTKNSILATVKAAGQATHLTQNGTVAMLRGAVRAAVWTNDRLVSTAQLLNPFSWTKKFCPPKTSGKRFSDAPVRKIRKTVPKAIKKEGKPKKHSVVKSQFAGLTYAKGYTPPPAVTAQEVSAAAFAGVTEKMRVARALKDLSHQDEYVRGSPYSW
ncbi:hypothetical protein ACFL54_09210 [Planctomycetota bacterium]